MTRNIKNLKILIAVILFTILAGSLVQAQQRGPQGPPPLPTDEQIEEIVDELATVLSLTDYQTQQVSELYTAHFVEVKKQRDSNRSARETNREEMEQIKKSFEKEVKSLLTKEQQKQFDSFQKKHQAGQGGQQRPKR